MVFEMFGDHENIRNNGNFQISLPRAEAVLEYFKTTKKTFSRKKGTKWQFERSAWDYGTKDRLLNSPVSMFW